MNALQVNRTEFARFECCIGVTLNFQGGHVITCRKPHKILVTLLSYNERNTFVEWWLHAPSFHAFISNQSCPWFIGTHSLLVGRCQINTHVAGCVVGVILRKSMARKIT